MSKKDKIRNAQQEARQALAGNNNAHSPSGSLVICDPTTGWNKNAQIVKAQFLLAGLDPDVLLPSPPDYGTAFSRSILPIQQMCQGRGYTLLKAGNGPNGESRYSVSAVQRNGVVETEDRATVICPRDGTAPHVERTTGDPQADEIAAWLVRATHERFNNYSSEDVRQCIVRTLDHYGAVSLRVTQPHTTHWIPEAGAQRLTLVGETLEALGWGEVQVWETKLTQSNMANAAKVVNATLEERLKEFSKDAEKFSNNTDSARPGLTANALSRRIEEAKAIKEKAALYRTILGAAVESVDDRIRSVEISLKNSLDLISA